MRLLFWALVGYFLVGPVLAVTWCVASDVWRSWRWRRGAPARAAAQRERERISRELIAKLNAEAEARGDDSRFVLAGIDCLMVTYVGKRNRLRR